MLLASFINSSITTVISSSINLTQPNKKLTKRDDTFVLNPTINNGPIFKTYEDMFMSSWFRSTEPSPEVVAYVIEGKKHYQFAVSNTEPGTLLIEIEYGPINIISRERVPISGVLRAYNNGTAMIMKQNSFSISYSSRTLLGVKVDVGMNPGSSISTALTRINQLNSLISAVEVATGNPGGVVQAIPSILGEAYVRGIENVYDNIMKNINSLLREPLYLVPQILNFTLSYNFHNQGASAASNTRTFAGTTSCSTGINGAVQMFSDISLFTHPRARARLVIFVPDENRLVDIGDWQPIISDPNHPEAGVIAFDNSNGIGYSCSTTEEDFVDETARIFNIDNPNFDLLTFLST